MDYSKGKGEALPSPVGLTGRFSISRSWPSKSQETKKENQEEKTQVGA